MAVASKMANHTGANLLQREGKSERTSKNKPEVNIQGFKPVRRKKGQRRGTVGSLIRDQKGKNSTTIPSGTRSRGGGVLKVGPGKHNLLTTQSVFTHGDRLHGPMSEPNASMKSEQGFSGKIVWKTPTTVAPISRIAFPASGDMAPVSHPLSASQLRVGSVIQKRRFSKNGSGRHVPPHQRAHRGDRSIPERPSQKGNLRSRSSSQGTQSIIQPPNHEDTDITSLYPNPIEPMAANNPVEQQGNQYSNFRDRLRIPLQSKNIPFLSKSRGFDRNLDGLGNLQGPFETPEHDTRLDEMIAHEIAWN